MSKMRSRIAQERTLTGRTGILGTSRAYCHIVLTQCASVHAVVAVPCFDRYDSKPIGITLLGLQHSLGKDYTTELFMSSDVLRQNENQDSCKASSLGPGFADTFDIS